MFPRRPRIARGDRLIAYAAGSAREFGEGRIYAVFEVVSDEPEPSGHERWPWQLRVRLLDSTPRLAHAPSLREIGVSPMSLRQHSHIRLTDDQGETAERLIAESAAWAAAHGPGLS